MDKEIIEWNKLIAEFMGASFPTLDKSVFAFMLSEERFPYNMCRCAIQDLKYHTSWDWLMPAVKKWNDLVISKRTGGEAGWTKWQYKTVMLRTEINPVFKDLVEAIKWYNQNK